MTPIERKAILNMLRTIETAISNMCNTKTNFNDIANLNEMVVAVEYCIDVFEATAEN